MPVSPVSWVRGCLSLVPGPILYKKKRWHLQSSAACSPPPLWHTDKSTLDHSLAEPMFKGSWGLDLWELENPTQKVPLRRKRKIPKYRHLCFPQSRGTWVLCVQELGGSSRPEQTPPNMKTEPSLAAFVLTLGSSRYWRVWGCGDRHI